MHKENREQIREYQKGWRERNRKRIRQKAKERYLKMKEAVAAYNRKYYQANKELIFQKRKEKAKK